MLWEKISLFFRRYSLKGELELFKTLKEAKGVLVRLSEENTFSDISSIAVLKSYYNKAQFWAIIEDSKMPLLRCVSIFDKTLFYENHKDIATQLKGYQPQVFIDFNHPGSIKLALISHSQVRWGFYSKSAFPYFNLLVKNSEESNNFYSSFSLIAPFVKETKPKEITLKPPKELKEKAKQWLKMKGYKRGKRLLILDPKFFGALRGFLQDRVKGLILNGGEIEREILPGVVSLANYFIGGPGLLFELSLGFKRHTLLLLIEKEGYLPELDFLKTLTLKDFNSLPYKEIEEFVK